MDLVRTRSATGPAPIRRTTAAATGALLALSLVGAVQTAATAVVVATGTVTVHANVPAGTSDAAANRALALTSSGVNVLPGDVITLTATGTAANGSAAPNGPDGQVGGGPGNPADFPAIAGPTPAAYSLVATVDSPADLTSGTGDEWFAVGSSRTITADRAGLLQFAFYDALYLPAWSNGYEDNNGAFVVSFSVDRAPVPGGQVTAVCDADVGTCTAVPPTGPDNHFTVTANGGTTDATLEAQLNGGTEPNCRGYTERSSDWVRFGFTDPDAGLTWSKTVTLTSVEVRTKRAARKELGKTQICFEAPYLFRIRPGYQRTFGPAGSGPTNTGVLPECSTLAGRNNHGLALPCVSSREVVPAAGGWATRIAFRVPAGEQDPKGRS